MSIVAQTSPGWQADFLTVLPAIRTHAQIQFRRLPPVHREEAVQETIAAACVSYHALAVRGRLHVARRSTLADYAVKRARGGRHVGGSQDAAQDVLSPVARRRHGVQVVSYHRRPPGVTECWRGLVVADRKASIPDLAAIRIDFAVWLNRFSHRDRKIISTLAGGDGTFAVAERFGISPGRVSQLRRKYERDWHVFQGEGGDGDAA